MATRRGISCGSAGSALAAPPPGACALGCVAAPPHSSRPTTSRQTAERLVAIMVSQFEPLAWAKRSSRAEPRAGRVDRNCGRAPIPTRILARILGPRQPARAPRSGALACTSGPFWVAKGPIATLEIVALGRRGPVGAASLPPGVGEPSSTAHLGLGDDGSQAAGDPVR